MAEVDFWNNRYSVDHFIFGTEPNGFLASVASRIPLGPVLCLAEGEGRNAVFLARLGHEVTAVDQSETGLAKARSLGQTNGVEIHTQVADLENYHIEQGAWSGIVWIFGHFAPALRGRLLREATLGLKPGGVFILECYCPKQLRYSTGGPKDPAFLVSEAIVREGVDGLRCECLHETERDICEGTGHTGIGAVVQFVGIKP